MLVFIAALCAAGGVSRMWLLARGGQPPDRDVLLFFLAAGVTLLAESVSRLKFGDFEVERVKELEDRVEELAEVNRPAAMTESPIVPVRASAPSPTTAAVLADAQESQIPPSDRPMLVDFDALVKVRQGEIYKTTLGWSDDPLLDKGPSQQNGSVLSATVSPSANYANAFRIVISLVVSRSLMLPANPRVAFFLHHSFPDPVRIVPLEARRASLTIISAGSFTAGALLPDGTMLTLDLARSPLVDRSALTPERQQLFENT